MGLKDNKYILYNFNSKQFKIEEIIIAQTLQKPEDTNLIYYKFTAVAISSFIEKYSKNKQNIDPQKTIEYIKEISEKYEDSGKKSLFVKELSEVIEKVLQNRSIIELTNTEDPYNIVEKVINNFTIEFEKKYLPIKQNEILEKLGIDIESQYYLSISFHLLEFIIILLSFSTLLRINRNL